MSSNKVVFAISDALGSYWHYTAVALASLLAHASEKPQILVLHDGTLHERAKQRLSLIAKHGGAQISYSRVELQRPINNHQLGPYTIASLYRLMIPSIIEGDEAVLYLDSDLVVHGVDVNGLFALIREKKAPLLAARDQFISLSDSHRKHLEALGLKANSYLNSGVLGFYPSKLSSHDRSLLQDFFRWSAEVKESHHPDQEFLNLRFKDRWIEIDERYNFHVSVYQRRMFLALADYDKKILHYAGKTKPLDGSLAPGCIPFWSYTSQVPELLSKPEPMKFHYLMPIAQRDHAASALVIKPR